MANGESHEPDPCETCDGTGLTVSTRCGRNGEDVDDVHACTDCPTYTNAEPDEDYARELREDRHDRFIEDASDRLAAQLEASVYGAVRRVA